MKKILSLAIVLSMLAMTCNAYFTVGERSFSLPVTEYQYASGVNITGNEITIDKDGFVIYDFFLPFNSESVTIIAECSADCSLTITDSFSDSVNLLNGMNEKKVKFNVVKRKGETSVKFAFSQAVTLKEIIFNKVETSEHELPKSVCALSENENAVFTSVIIDLDAGAIMVNGAMRYINIDNAKDRPLVVGGSTYLPIETLARALGYYYEDLPNKGYALLRHEGTDFVFSSKGSYKQKKYNAPEPIASRILYKNGVTYAAVRYFAEQAGKTVGFKDGLVIIDDKYSVSNILSSTSVMSFIKSSMSTFKNVTQGSTYYVAKTGDDMNCGSKEEPFKTLAKAGEVAKAGDKVVIREGVYRETLTPKNDGTGGSPIVFESYPGERVVVSAADPVTDFVNNGNFLSAQINNNLGVGRNQVYYKGEALAEARHPNGPIISPWEDKQLSPLFPVKGDFKPDTANSLIVYSSTLLDQPINHWQGATFVSMHGYGWVLGTAKVSKSEPGKLTLTDTASNWWFESTSKDIWNFGYLTGHQACLDAQGEWFMDGQELLFIPPSDFDGELEVKSRQLTMDLSNRKFVQIKGIESFAGGINMNGSEMCVLNGVSVKYLSHFTHSKDQRDGYIDDGDVRNPNGAPARGEVGIYLGGANNAVVNSTIDHSAGAGIYIVGKYDYIANNVISNTGYMGSYVSGITVGVKGWEPQTTPRGGFSIYNNTVYNCGRSAFNMQSISWPQGTYTTPFLPFEIAFNDFHDGILFSLDGGIVYEYFIQGETDKLQSRFNNNYVYYTGDKTNPYSFGVYHDNFTTGIDTFENVVFTTKENVKFSNQYIFKQPDSVCSIWNNVSLPSFVGGGPAGLKANDFPMQKPFFAGAMRDGEYLVNYNNIKDENYGVHYYKAKDAVKSSGVTIDQDGLANFSASGDYLKFENVDFGNGSNLIFVNLRGDKYKNADSFSLIIGDNIDAGKRYNFQVKSGAPRLYQNDIYAVNSKEFSGVQTVYLKLEAKSSTKIDGIYLPHRGEPKKQHNMSEIFGGEYDNIDKIGNANYPPRPIYSAPGGPLVMNTFGGTVLRYDDVLLTDDATKVNVTLSVDESNSGQTINIYIGSISSTPIAQIVSAGTGFGNAVEFEVELTGPLPSGIYDIYVSFEGVGKTMNFHKFGFM